MENFKKEFEFKFKCFFIDEIDKLAYDESTLPIVILRRENFYYTVKTINYYTLLTLFTTVKSVNMKTDLKVSCSKYFNDEIGKSILAEYNTKNSNENLEKFVTFMMECETMKEFSEQVVNYLKYDNFDEECFNFWSFIADLESNINLRDTLNNYKQLFIEIIEECIYENEDKHQSTLMLIDDLIEKNERSQKYLDLLRLLKEEIINSLSIYENLKPNSQIRVKLTATLESNYKVHEVLKKIIANDCLNIDLKFNSIQDEEEFFMFLSSEEKTTNALLKIIEKFYFQPLSKLKIK